MAIARLSGQDALGTSATTSVSATYPGATTSGNTLLATVYMNVTTGLATISGWTLLKEGAFSGTAQNVAIWGKIATGSETTITASGATGATIMRMHIYEYSGCAASLTSDGTQSATSGVTNVTTLASGSITTANANDLLIMALGTGGSTSGHAFTGSFNIRQSDASVIRLVDADQIVAATGTYSSTPTWVTSVRAGIAFITLKAASGTAYTQTLTETLTMSDTLVKLIKKSLSDSITLSDTLVRLISRTFSETISVTDTVLKKTSRIFTETLTISDTLLKTAQKLLAESITISDTLTKLSGKVLTETVTLTDILIKVTNRTFTETITLTDSLLKKTFKVLVESYTLTDIFSGIKVAVKILTESITLSDTLNKSVSKSLLETLVLTDSLIKSISKTLTEQITLTDILGTVKSAGRHVKNYYTGGISAAKRMMRGIGW